MEISLTVSIYNYVKIVVIVIIYKLVLCENFKFYKLYRLHIFLFVNKVTNQSPFYNNAATFFQT